MPAIIHCKPEDIKTISKALRVPFLLFARNATEGMDMTGEIHVIVLPKIGDAWAWCAWDTVRTPRRLLVCFTPECLAQCPEGLAATIVHEFTHAKQCLENRLKVFKTHYYWEGEKFPRNIPYAEMPWEKDAQASESWAKTFLADSRK